MPASVLAGFAVAIAAVLITAWLAFDSLQDRSAAAERITRAYDVLVRLQRVFSFVKDAETGQRGYLLTGAESYLDPYDKARVALPGEVQSLQSAVKSDPEQQRRLDAFVQTIDEKLAELSQSIALKRSGDSEAALALVRTDRGKSLMDRIRDLAAEMGRSQRALLVTQQADWQQTADYSTYVTLGGAAVLLAMIGLAFLLTARSHRERETQLWLRAGQSLLSERMQGDQRLETLGDKVLDFVAVYLDAQVASLYVADAGGRFRRVAGYAIAPGKEGAIAAGQGLLGQAARDRRTLHVRDVPADYLAVNSSLGRANARELLVAPATIDGAVQAVIELGFLRRLGNDELALMERVAESVGVAVRASKDRSRLEELLVETQAQSEELQTQQEELRVSNEELEEQGRALKESQGALEEQQAELEATNSQLEEHTRLLEDQKEALSNSQRELVEKAVDLERSSQYKSEFLANMSHELRTPLNSTLILAKLLADNKEGNLTEEQVKFATTIGSAGNDLLVLINDVLDLSKIEAGKAEVEVKQVTLARLLDSLTRTFQPMAVEKGLGFAAEVEPGAPARIDTDGQRLGQILKNLLSNAVKFTDRGEVTVRARAAGADAVAFVVSDSGIGIDAEQHELVFEAFRQADGSTHRKYGGTGLGLAISKLLAELMGGAMWAESLGLGLGSTFHFTMRAQAAELPAGARRDFLGVQPALQGKRILVVDDNATNRRILALQMARWGMVVDDIEHPERALAMLASVAYDLAIVDMHMPGMDGSAMAAGVRSAGHTLPLVLFSSHGRREEADSLFAATLAKPLRQSQLFDTLVTLLAHGAAPKVAQTAIKPKIDATLAARHPLRILLAEDNVVNQKLALRLLQQMGYRADLASNGIEAIESIERQPYDVVLMDVQMPEMDGLEASRRIKARWPSGKRPRIVAMTANAMQGDREACLAAGMDDYVVKPIRVDALVEALLQVAQRSDGVA